MIKMENINCKEENGNQMYGREFELTRDFKPEDFRWLMFMNQEHYHHDMRVGYENGEGFKDLFYVDHESNLHFSGVKGTVENGNLERQVEKSLENFGGVLPAGKKLYIEATGICRETQSEAKELIRGYVHGMPYLLSGKVSDLMKY